LSSGIVHDNGDILFIGTALFGDVYEGSLQRSWLVRVDSNGCYGPGDCPPSLSIDRPLLKLANRPRLYPNPTQNAFWVELNDVNDRINMVRLIDHSGKTVKILQNNFGQLKMRFPIDNFPPGNYIVNVEMSSGVNWNLRLVKIE
jgi:hypothetical protein